MNTFFQHLRDPEYMHVLLNPLPVYGLAFGTLALALALLLRNYRVSVAALVLVFVGAMSAWPVYQYGESAYDRVKAMSDPAGEQWLDEHMARGEKLIWAFYVLAGISAIGIPGSKMAAVHACCVGGNPGARLQHARHWRLHRLCRRSR